MIDLFDTPVLPGLSTCPDIITRDEERELIEAIDRADLSPFKFQGWEGKRLTRSYGWTYDFDTGRASQAEPIPEWLNPLKERAEAFAGMSSGSIVQALVIRYDPGAGIGWHKDRPMFGRVVGVSLGSEAVMRFRQRTDRGFDRVTCRCCHEMLTCSMERRDTNGSTALLRSIVLVGLSRSEAWPKKPGREQVDHLVVPHLLYCDWPRVVHHAGAVWAGGTCELI